MFDYFYGRSGEMFSYFRVPKILFQDIKFKDLSTDAKTLYGILLDRMGLSVKNGWLDEQGRVYIIFPVQEVMDALGCADNKATKLFRELEKFGLIERKRRGLGKPNLIYVKNFADPRFRNREKNGSGAADSAQPEAAKSHGAILRVASMRENIEPGRLIRYGFPKDEKIQNNHYLSAYNLAIYKNPELLKKRNQLVALNNSLDKHDVKRVQVEKELEQIRQSLKATEQQYVREGRFVATTVSKAVVDRTIRGTSYDVVIFDEASMAAIPQIMYAASLARKHFVCMGDFRQLPPIVQSGKESLLNADIFQYCGITQAVDQGSNHKWLCLLDTQYRMHPEIAGFAGKSIYNGLLKSANGMAEKREKTVTAEPFAGRAMEFVDLSGIMSTCIKSSDDSHANVLSAFVAFSLALKAAQTQKVGIITPYHAQSRLLHAMVRDVNELETLPHTIKCATVHQF